MQAINVAKNITSAKPMAVLPPHGPKTLAIKSPADVWSVADAFKGPRIVSLPDGTPALDVNNMTYDSYLTQVMPHLKLDGAQKWGTWMIRKLYQGTTRKTVYKWFGNPCHYKNTGNLSCSEYTLMMLQTCGFKKGVAQGWKRIRGDSVPNPFQDPSRFWSFMLAGLPFVGKSIRTAMPKPLDKPIPLSWFTDPATVHRLANLP